MFSSLQCACPRLLQARRIRQPQQLENAHLRLVLPLQIVADRLPVAPFEKVPMFPTSTQNVLTTENGNSLSVFASMKSAKRRASR